uniref:Uncharacterized protein n=1 Tax=Cucumis melo TaxID=3656 RepID=A0A9I9E5K0_CUCME
MSRREHWFEKPIANMDSNSVKFSRRGINHRPEDTMVEGSGSKRESSITSKKRGRNEPPKEDAIVKKKQTIKSLYNEGFDVVVHGGLKKESLQKET